MWGCADVGTRLLHAFLPGAVRIRENDRVPHCVAMGHPVVSVRTTGCPIATPGSPVPDVIAAEGSPTLTGRNPERGWGHRGQGPPGSTLPWSLPATIRRDRAAWGTAG